MRHNAILDEIFGGDPLPFRNVYETAQFVVRDYMAKHNCKIEKVAELLGTTSGHLYAVLDPKQDHKPLSVDRVIELTILTGDTRIIDAMKETAKSSCECESGGISEVMMATLHVQAHTGELSSLLSTAISDGDLDEKEREAIRKKAIDEIGALQNVVNMMK